MGSSLAQTLPLCCSTEPSEHSLQYTEQTMTKKQDLKTTHMVQKTEAFMEIPQGHGLYSWLPLGVPNQCQREEVTAQFSNDLLREETSWFPLSS